MHLTQEGIDKAVAGFFASPLDQQVVTLRQLLELLKEGMELVAESNGGIAKPTTPTSANT